jgi:oligopeptide transport system ATP-binding protein
LIPIEGNPVDLINPPKGCAFAPRCKHCMKVCQDMMPPVYEASEGHNALCWLAIKEDYEKEAVDHGKSK